MATLLTTSRLLRRTGSCFLKLWARLPALAIDAFDLLGGDWNFEPDDFPIDLVHGATVHRPLSDEVATSPVLHGEDTAENGTKIDWFLVSKSLITSHWFGRILKLCRTSRTTS
eukprot:4771017-Amphidinium_carterae.1